VLAIRKVRSDPLIRKRQFLTPVKYPTSSSSYHPQSFKACTTHNKDCGRSYSSGQDGHHAEPLPQPQLTSLLPLPRMSMHGLREHAVTRSYLPTATLQHRPLPYHMASYQAKVEPGQSRHFNSPTGASKSLRSREEKRPRYD
jgi:hypothetical protein